MTEEKVQQANPPDPSVNVRSIVYEATQRFDDLQKAEVKRIDEKIYLTNDKVQSQFTSAKEAVGIASTAQEKAMAAALEGTKDAINKADTNTDKRFGAISEKIDNLAETISKSTGAQGIYVTHTDLSNEMSKLRADFETMLRPVITYMNSSQGRSSGLNSGWIYLIGGVGLIATILSIITVIMNFSK